MIAEDASLIPVPSWNLVAAVGPESPLPGL